MGRKKKSKDDDDDFVVEVITGAKVAKEEDEDGNEVLGWEYHVQWYGYPQEFDTWEPQVNLHACERLLTSFWGAVGMDSEDYPIGYTINATEEWIEEERKTFYTDLEKENKIKRAKGKEPAPIIRRGTSASTSSRASSSKAEATKPSRSKAAGKSKLSKLDTSSESEAEIKKPVAKRQRKQPVVASDPDSGSESPVVQSVSSKRKKANKPTPSEPPAKRKKTVPEPATKSKKPRVTRKALVSSDEETPPPSPNTTPVKKMNKGAPSQTPAIENTSPSSLFSGADSSGEDVPLAKVSLAQAASTSTGEKAKRKRPQLTKLSLASSSKSPQSSVVPAPTLGRLASQTARLSGSPNIPPASGLSTKARLAELAATLTNPKDNAKAKKKMPTFKKKSISDASMTTPPQEYPSYPDPAPQLRQTSSRVLPKQQPPSKPVAHEMEDDLGFEHAPAPASPAIADSPMHDAGQWLNDNMGDLLNAPPSTSQNKGPSSSVFVPHRPVPSLSSLKISKKWTWEGTISRTTDQGPVPLGHANITDLADRKVGGARLEHFIKDITHIELGYLRPVHDLDLLLPALKEWQHFARLTISSTDKSTAKDVLISYMQKKILFAVSPVFSPESDESYGIMIVYPSMLDQISMKLDKPTMTDKLSGTYNVAFYPWLITPVQFIDNETVLEPGYKLSTQKDWRRDILNVRTYHDSVHSRSRRVIRDKPECCRALRILGVPPPLAESLAKQNRRVFVWKSPQCIESGEGVEHGMLMSLFRRHPSLKIETNLESPRWIFVHQSAVRTLPQLVRFSTIRARRPGLMILLYGTDLSVDPSRWRVRQIFPLGGVITFTLTAVMREPLLFFQVVAQIQKNKLWACYIPPFVLGAIIRRVCGNEDPWIVYQKREFILTRLMSYIGEGTIAISQSPPDKRHPQYEEALARWAQIQLTGAHCSTREILQRCLANFEGQFGHLSEERQTLELVAAACNDLSAMQQEPVMMDNYRRFVAIVPADQITHTPVDHSIETIPLREFKFSDLQLKETIATLPPDLEAMSISGGGD